jgi:hypothetical protein
MKDLEEQIKYHKWRVRILMRKYVCPQCKMDFPKGKHCVFSLNDDEDLCDRSGY